MKPAEDDEPIRRQVLGPRKGSGAIEFINLLQKDRFAFSTSMAERSEPLHAGKNQGFEKDMVRWQNTRERNFTNLFFTQTYSPSLFKA
mmetsp:Transcript_27187/g.38253  ORF Transcript_27187/g.38253 Transcript_27187/m.38253 type:complete len:88 (+) Transcript_27187:464-727(+)